MKFQVLYSILILANIFYLNSLAQNSDSRIATIDSVFKQLKQKRNFNGNVLIAEMGEVIYEKSFGYAHKDNKLPLDNHSIFDIGSIAKTFTAVCILKLAQENKLGLSDPVVNHIPGFPYPDIKLKNLLSHTSGLVEEQRKTIFNEIKNKAFTNNQIKDTFLKIKPPLNFPPGTEYQYSNSNYTFLALIFETVSGKDLPDYLQEHIFDKFEMKDTFFNRSSATSSNHQHLVSNYQRAGIIDTAFVSTDEINKIEALTWKNKYGGDKISSTARDLLKFHNALQNEKILNQKFLETMYTSFELKGNKDYTINRDSNNPAMSALSWRIGKNHSFGKVVYHSGGIPGGRCHFSRNISNNQCIIVLTNNEELNRYDFTFPMQVLNNQTFQLDKTSLLKQIGKIYATGGIEAAIKTYNELEKSEDYIPFIDWDFEELAEELLEVKDTLAALEIYKLYSKKYPKDHFSWALLGETHHWLGNKTEAIKYLKKSLEQEPAYEHAKLVLKELLTEE